MKGVLREHLALVVALLLPVLLIIGVLVVLYLPQLLVADPMHKVLYRQRSNDAACGYQYEVENSRLQARADNRRDGTEREQCTEGAYQHDTFYIYDPATDEHTRVSYSEVVDRTIEESRRAPDGYRISPDRYYAGGFLFFDGGHEDGWRMHKDGARHTMTFDHISSYPRPEFVGWIN